MMRMIAGGEFDHVLARRRLDRDTGNKRCWPSARSAGFLVMYRNTVRPSGVFEHHAVLVGREGKTPLSVSAAWLGRPALK